jgi:hypothetical protein
MGALERSKLAFEGIKGNPKTRDDLAIAAPVIKK